MRTILFLLDFLIGGVLRRVRALVPLALFVVLLGFDASALGLGRGIAVLQLWGTVIALVLEARVADGAITVPRATVAVDCGLAINPLGVAAQVESGVIFGLSAALHGEVTIKGGRVEQSNYHDYRILRLNEAPAITTHIVESAADPGGMGEPPCAVVAPALANAVFAASGKRLRTLPLAMALERAS